jgi:hypothetical protein
MKGVLSDYETQFHIHTQHIVTWGGGGGGGGGGAGGGGEMEGGKNDDDDDDNEISNVHIVVTGLTS